MSASFAKARKANTRPQAFGAALMPPSRIDYATGPEPRHASALIVYRQSWLRRAWLRACSWLGVREEIVLDARRTTSADRMLARARSKR